MAYRYGSSEQSTRQRRLKRPVAVESILESALGRFGLADDLRRYQFVLKWPEIVGEEVALRAKPESFKNGVLIVRVSDSVWAQELSFRKEYILKRMRKYLSSSDRITDIRFCVAGSFGRAA